MKINELLSLVKDIDLNGTVEILSQDKTIGKISFLNKDILIYLNDAGAVFSLFKNFFQISPKSRKTTEDKLPRNALNNISNMFTSFGIKVTVFQNNNEILSIGRGVNSVLLGIMGIKNVKIKNMAEILNLYAAYKKGALPLKEIELNIKDLNAVIKI